MSLPPRPLPPHPAGLSATHRDPAGGVLDLLPGDVAVGSLGDRFRTLLGSCIAVILTDPRRTVGAMCHIVHVGDPSPADADNTAFGRPAMEEMFARLRRMGINPDMCEAFVYGGGNMFPELFRTQHVGASNAEWVRGFLQQHGITVMDEQIGGNGYRRIVWTVGAHMPQVEFISPAPEAQHAD